MTKKANANKWKDKIINELIICHIYTSEHDNNPKKAVDDLMNWHAEVGAFFERESSFGKRLKRKMEYIWYSFLNKILKIQPPF